MHTLLVSVGKNVNKNAHKKTLVIFRLVMDDAFVTNKWLVTSATDLLRRLGNFASKIHKNLNTFNLQTDFDFDG